MTLGFFRPYIAQPDYLAPAELARVRQEIVDSPYLGATTLNERFSTTLGFSVTLTREGLPRVPEQWPAIAAYLDRALDPECNAFFLNPLVVGGGSHVDTHIDCSLRGYTAPEDPPFPRKVTVLYVDVPEEMQGGQLVIYRAMVITDTIRPRTNLLVEFLGSLRHEVSPVLPLERPRVSLVCEQYQLPPDLLRLIPSFHLNTRRAFDDFLEKELELSDSEGNS